MSKTLVLLILLVLAITTKPCTAVDINGIGVSFSDVYSELQGLESQLPYITDANHFVAKYNSHLASSGHDKRTIEVEEFEKYLVKDLPQKDANEGELSREILLKIDKIKKLNSATKTLSGANLIAPLSLARLIEATTQERDFNYSYFAKLLLGFRSTLAKDFSVQDRDAIFDFVRSLKGDANKINAISKYTQKLREAYAIQIARSNASHTFIAELNAKLRLASSMLNVSEAIARGDHSEFSMVSTNHEELADTKTINEEDFRYMSAFREIISSELRAGWLVGSFSHYGQALLIAVPFQRIGHRWPTDFPKMNFFREHSQNLQAEWDRFHDNSLLEIMSLNGSYTRQGLPLTARSLADYRDFAVNYRLAHIEMLPASLAAFLYCYYNYSKNAPGLGAAMLESRDPKQIDELSGFLENWRAFELTNFDVLYANPKRHDDILQRIARLQSLVYGK